MIENNVIEGNSALYGAGMVLNFSDATVRNNLFFNNRGGQDFGGAGIFVFEEPPSGGAVLTNNTIVSNVSYGSGSADGGRAGGIFNYLANNMSYRNNLLAGNQSRLGNPFHTNGGTNLDLQFNVVQGTTLGLNNGIFAPDFLDSAFFLGGSYPAIDFGENIASMNDVEDPNSPGNPLLPSKGTLRNDAGAYGGPHVAFLPIPLKPVFYTNPNAWSWGGFTLTDTVKKSLIINNLGSLPLTVTGASFSGGSGFDVKNTFPLSLGLALNDTLEIEYLGSFGTFQDTLWISHNDPNEMNPFPKPISGTLVSGLSGGNRISLQLHPNPARNSVNLAGVKGKIQQIELIDLQGKSHSISLIQNRVSWDNLPQGIYFLKGKTNEGFFSEKLVIEN